ncbi:MAG: ABC transporter permease [Candidatus Bipolaricaulota bacterium]|nr:ABC transporter permease [Candidatus Bipolaricaulota bacterium]
MPRSIKDYTGTVLVLILFFLLWELGARGFNVPSYILPAPSRVLYVFFSRFTFLLGHATMTLLEVALGIIFGTAGGISLALVIFYSPSLERALYPLIIASQMIPIFAIAPLLVLWFGYGLWPKATVAALIVFFPIVINTVDGLRAVSGETIDLLRSLRASEWQIFRMIRLPASLPSLFSGLKVGIPLSVVGATIGEWIGAKRGLGYLMIQSNALLRTDVVFAAILALSLLGLLLFALLCMIERRLLRWRIPIERKVRR